MAYDVNTKFIANPSFGVTSTAGQAITLTIDSYAKTNVYVGYKSVYFDSTLYNGVAQGLISVSPGATFNDAANGAAVQPVAFFLGFVRNNPIHIKKMNIRATSAGTLPSSIEIQTPNVFTGQMDRQIINVTADSNMYQNQSNIVTLDTDVFLCRESIVVFNAAFNENAGVTLGIDIVFDKYLSLEKALVENYELLNTTAGQAAAIETEIATVNAKLPTASAKVVPVSVDYMSRDIVGGNNATATTGKQNPWRGLFGFGKR